MEKGMRMMNTMMKSKKVKRVKKKRMMLKRRKMKCLKRNPKPHQLKVLEQNYLIKRQPRLKLRPALLSKNNNKINKMQEPQLRANNNPQMMKSLLKKENSQRRRMEKVWP
jgi:Golgi nucleoside diphosphatase